MPVYGTLVGNVVAVGVDDGFVGYGVRVAVADGVPVSCTEVGVLLGDRVRLAVGVSVPKMLMMITLGVVGTLGTHNLPPAARNVVVRQLAF